MTPAAQRLPGQLTIAITLALQDEGRNQELSFPPVSCEY